MKAKIEDATIMLASYLIIVIFAVMIFFALIVPLSNKFLNKKTTYVPVPCEQEIPGMDIESEVKFL